MTAPPRTIKGTVAIDVKALYEQLGGIPHRETVEAAVDNAWLAQREQVINDVIESVEATHTFGAAPDPDEPEPEQAETKDKSSSSKSSSAKGSSSKKK
jgi:hypothetical protein